MKVSQLLLKSREIWGKERLNLSQILVRQGVVFGDLCRCARGEKVDKSGDMDAEIKKELGNIIFSTIRWCDDLGYDPNDCIREAMGAQERFVKKNRS